MERIALILILLTSACTGDTEAGECVGLLNDDEMKPGVSYHISKWNVLLAIIFSESLVIPGYVAAFEYKCPVEVED